jgi:Fur family ferric uptake transcriptional regulator
VTERKKDLPERKVENSELKKAGLKITLPRIKILNILERTRDRHINAEEIYKLLLESGDDVGLATVYRVLTQFEAAGLVKRHYFETGYAVFELNEGEHHDHIVCIKCGKVEEFFDPIIEARQASVAQKHNFLLTDHYLYLYGYCQLCQQDLADS